MSGMSQENLHTRMASGIRTLLQREITESPRTKLLSVTDAKVVEVAKSASGNDFVRRWYSKDALGNLLDHGRGQPDFQTAWDTMTRLFADAGVPIVPSAVFFSPEKNSRFPVVVVSELVSGEDAIRTVPLSVKRTFARGLGKLIAQSGDFVYHPQMINEGSFGVQSKTDGEKEIVLIDVDPYILRAKNMDPDVITALKLKHVADLLYDRWALPHEREDISSSLMAGAGELVLQFDPISTRVGQAFQVIQLMKSGIDMRADTPGWSNSSRER